jgi:GT2 family glycosyltransferase
MTRREALEDVGFLDETFFMYGEDIDWCQRFQKAGWKRLYFTGAAAIHYGGGSSSNAPVRFYIEQQRAILQYFKKHHNLIERRGFLVSMWIYHVVRIVGHGINYLLPGSNREDVVLKMKRSMASIRWLLGVEANPLGGN